MSEEWQAEPATSVTCGGGDGPPGPPTPEAVEPLDLGGGAAEEEEEEGADLDRDDIGRPVVPEWIRDAEPEDLALAVEAVCFVLNRPVSLAELSALLGRHPRSVSEAVDALASQLRSRGLMLQRHLDQIQLVTRPQVAWAAQRALNPEKPTRLSRPALETLAIVAYRQPVTRAGIESIRGVDCESVLESLERRGLVTEVGRAESPGQPRLFATTLRFLQLVGLETIAQLPPLPDGSAMPAEQRQAWSVALDGAADRGGEGDPPSVAERP
ncbi:MAG TPA: SMC-Scp complex subunit ScpB [Candidatus Binatia bacterium]|nr:SMC-Scp complex subunit ScpB [Candidatus Binatia bacterium]